MASLLYEDDRRSGSLVCAVCGYGVARDTPPGPCPMCRTDDAWVDPSRRRLGNAAVSSDDVDQAHIPIAW